VAITPGVLGKRYTPLLVIAAVQVVLVAVAPSNGGNNQSSTVGTGSYGSTSGSALGQGGGAAGGTASGAGATGAAGAASGTGSSGGAAGGGTQGGLASSGGGGGGGGGNPVADPGCVNGRQSGPTFYMPPCSPTYVPGPSSMTGVTPTQIKFIYYLPMGNAEVNAILNEENLAATPQQECQAVQAFTTELNKRWELYGRKLVSLDGPGNHSGSAEGGSSCNFPFFQGQCNLTPPDIPCYEAEADLIASMKPAIVIAPAVYPQFYFRLAQDHILVVGGSAGAENFPESYFDQLAPYYYNVFPSGTQTAQQIAEFYCKKLVNRPVQFAGQGPNDVIPLTGTPPIRKLGIVYPSNNGDTTIKQTADYLSQLVGQCGGQDTQEYSYASDITTAQQQTDTTVAAIKTAHVTTVVCLCDPIAPVFLTGGLDQQGYHAEWLIPGSGLLDYDVLGQLYNKNEMRYAFGPSELTESIPFANTDAVKAWQDAGNSGEPDATQNLNWAYFSLAGSMLQMGGPQVSLASIRNGLSGLPGYGGDPVHALIDFRNPFPWSGIKDFREVWFCPTQTSPINNQPGTYVEAFSGHRFQLGQLSGGDSEMFPNGPCA
jgi:hypothetical protein